MTTTVHHARPGRLRDWLPRRRQRPVVAAIHGAAADPLKTNYIVTGGQALPGLVERTEPASVKTTTTTGSTVGYDTEPWSMDLAEGFAGRSVLDQPQRVPGSSGLQPLVPVEPLADAGLLGRVRDGIRDLDDGPPARLRFFTDGRPSLPEPLEGLPKFIGPGVIRNRQCAGLQWGTNEDGAWVSDEFSPERLEALALAAIEAIPHLTSDPGHLEAIIFAAQSALDASTRGGPAVDQTGGAQ